MLFLFGIIISQGTNSRNLYDSRQNNGPLISCLESKVGDVISIPVLRSKSKKEVSLKIDQQNHKLFFSAILELGFVIEIGTVSSLSLPYAG